MKGFKRGNPLFSLCGLNCGLCPMKIGGHCSGCGFGNQSCRIAKCSLEHGSVEYCFQCEEYPCGRYEHIDDYDSFITHQHRKSDLEKAEHIGMSAYNQEQEEKAEILEVLLSDYNDGRRKTFYPSRQFSVNVFLFCRRHAKERPAVSCRGTFPRRCDFS